MDPTEIDGGCAILAVVTLPEYDGRSAWWDVRPGESAIEAMIRAGLWDRIVRGEITFETPRYSASRQTTRIGVSHSL